MNQRPLPSRIEDFSDDRFIHFGGPIDKVTVSLRLFGEDLNPDEVTELLGCDPTSARRKGDVIPGRYHRMVHKGCWLLKGLPPSAVGLEQQVNDLLNKVTDDLAVWHNLTDRFDVDIFCGFFLECFNRGFNLPPELMKRLVDRRVRLEFDIYLEDYPPRLEQWLEETDARNES